MSNLQKFFMAFITLVMVLSLGSMAYLVSQQNTKQMADYERRLDLYRAAVEETEIKNLEAADVFEKTEAYQELTKMGESKHFCKNPKYSCE